MSRPLPPCPDCKAGKHRNCDGVTWDNEYDCEAACPCYELDPATHGEENVT